MQLVGQRIELSPLDESDFDLFVEISMSPEMMGHVSDPCSFEEANKAFTARLQAWSVENDSWLTFGISERLTSEKLGSIGLKVTNHKMKVAEVGFMIKRSAQAKEFAREALALVKDYALVTLQLNKLVAICSVNNNRSCKLLEKQGFIREACLEQNTIIGGQYIDDYIYSFCKRG